MITVKRYSGLEINRSEALRYAGAAKSPDGETLCLLDSCYEELSEARQGIVCYAETEVTRCGDGLLLGNIRIDSRDIEKYLDGCSRVVIFAATVGVTPDRLVRKYVRVSPVRALMTDAVGSALAEFLCDVLCKELRENAAKEGMVTLPRFSPGYGDLPLELQREIFDFLDCERKIGLSLNDSLLMTPTKSVTAIVGIRNKGER